VKNKIADRVVFCFLPLPASLTQAVRNFAKGLEGWLVNSLDQIPKKMADVKVSITAIHFSHCKCLRQNLIEIEQFQVLVDKNLVPE